MPDLIACTVETAVYKTGGSHSIWERQKPIGKLHSILEGDTCYGGQE